ncbi:MAG: rhomboid family intramembrane serine protease [Bacteroidetes bacterium]|nr:rhomboid family intramembrane serine protease [Bacteroidota bacterium]
MTEFRPSRFEILPTIVKNLLIINGLFFLAQNTFKGPSVNFSIEDVLALHAWQSNLFKPWQLVTHMFLHGDLGHIFGNMFALWMFGSVLENLWGSKRFLTFYLICGLGAALMHLLFLSYELMPLIKDYAAIFQQHADGGSYQADAMINFINKNKLGEPGYRDQLISLIRENPNDTGLMNKLFEQLTVFYQSRINTSTIGASGAVFGVLAAFVYLFPNTYLYIYFLVPVKAKWIGLLYFGYEVFFALKNSAGDNVARWAHIGGAIVGLLIVMTWNKNNKKTFY